MNLALESIAIENKEKVSLSTAAKGRIHQGSIELHNRNEKKEAVISQIQKLRTKISQKQHACEEEKTKVRE